MEGCYENGGKRRKPNLECIAGEDRLSSLPDSLLVEILSLLPLEFAVATSALSRRWQHLWTHVTHVRLNVFHWVSHSDYVACQRRSNAHKEGFFKNLGATLQKLASPKIRSLSVCFPDDGRLLRLCCADVGSWFPLLCARDPEEIRVSASDWDSRCLTLLPACVFRCSSLVSLRIKGSFCCQLPDGDPLISLPNLKYLSVSLSQWECNRELPALLFKSCPALEKLELQIYYSIAEGLVLDISCRNLRRLVLHVWGGARDCRLLIDTPKLEYFQVVDLSSVAYRFVVNPRELLEAKVGASYEDEEVDCLPRILKLIGGISSTRSLIFNHVVNLSDLYHLDAGAFPTFSNLTHLTMHCNLSTDFQIALLHSPNLECIDSRCTNCLMKLDTNLSSSKPSPVCLSSKLKRIRMRGLKGTEDELGLLSYVLSNGNVLQLLEIALDFPNRSRNLQLCEALDYTERLFSLSRSSISCEITFRSPYLTTSSKGFKDGSLDCKINYRGQLSSNMEGFD